MKLFKRQNDKKINENKHLESYAFHFVNFQNHIDERFSSVYCPISSCNY